jgi:hypothetical protein
MVKATMNLPVAAREIRVAAHDRTLYRARVWMAAATMLTTAWILYGPMNFTGRFNSSIGAQIFAMQAWVAFAFACMAMNATADSISREKRDGTLGLLFLTHLKGRDVTLGKLASGMTLIVTGLLAAMPVLALPILLGGIELQQALQLGLSLFNCMLFSASAGLLASAVCVNRQQAGSLAVMIVGFFCAVLPILSFSMRQKGMNADLCLFFEIISPFYAQRVSPGAMLGFQKTFFYISLGIVFLLSCVMLGITAWITPRSWQITDRPKLAERIRRFFRMRREATISSRSPLGNRILDRNAYEWLAARRMSAGYAAWKFLVIVTALAVAFIFYLLRSFEPAPVLMGVCLPAAYLIQLNFKVRVGGHVCDRLCEDRESNALELILSTPMTIAGMVRGIFGALRRHFLAPLLVIVPLLCLAWFLSRGGVQRLCVLFDDNPDPQTYTLRSFVVLLGFILFLVMDSLTMIWTGLWLSLATAKVAQARGATLVSVLVGPPAAFAMFVWFLEAGPLRVLVRNAVFYETISVMIAFALMGDLWFIRHCRRRLRERGQKTVSDPLIFSRDTPPPWTFLIRIAQKLRPRPQT